MKKLLGCAVGVLLSTSAMAQGTELFPELEGRFQPAKPAEVAKPVEQDANGEVKPAEQAGANAVQDKVVDAVQSGKVAPEEVTEAAGEGNIEIRLEDIEGTLALARNYSYCSAKVVLENKTNLKLEKLSLDLNYQGMPNPMTFSGVEKKGQQTQPLMMIGPECEAILNEPEITIQECKLGKQTEDACKGKVQFIPPNS